MTIQTKYITNDEFKEYTGIDLCEALDHENANPSDTANRFLKRVEDRMELFIKTTFFIQVPSVYGAWDDRQKICFKMALIEQAEYMYRNGDIAMDSGYNPENLAITDIKKKKSITICEIAYNYLIDCGFNREIGYNRVLGVGGLWL